MKFYQIHVIDYPKVNLFDVCERIKRDAVIKSNDEGKFILDFLPNHIGEVIKGVHKDSNDIGPVSVEGKPYVYSDMEK